MTGPGKENQTDVSGLETAPGPGLDHILEGPEVVPRTGGRLWAWKVSDLQWLLLIRQPLCPGPSAGFVARSAMLNLRGTSR